MMQVSCVLPVQSSRGLWVVAGGESKLDASNSTQDVGALITCSSIQIFVVSFFMVLFSFQNHIMIATSEFRLCDMISFSFCMHKIFSWATRWPLKLSPVSSYTYQAYNEYLMLYSSHGACYNDIAVFPSSSTNHGVGRAFISVLSLIQVRKSYLFIL
jgi:hypothetical protein